MKTLVVTTLLISMITGAQVNAVEGPGKKKPESISASWVPIVGDMKYYPQGYVICKGRRNSCGFAPDPSLSQTSYIFPQDWTGPYPEGAYMNEAGQMQIDGVTITVQGEETRIEFP